MIMKKIELTNVTYNNDFYPVRRCMFSELRYIESKRILARIIQQTSRAAKDRPARWLQDQIVCADIPAPGGGYCNALICIANSGNHPGGRGYFSAFDFNGKTYLYEAKGGALCLAQIPDDGPTAYYLIQA